MHRHEPPRHSSNSPSPLRIHLHSTTTPHTSFHTAKMLATSRTAALALRGTPITAHPCPTAKILTAPPAKPMTAITPFKAAAAAHISSSTKKPAEVSVPVRGAGSTVKGGPGAPPPMKAITGKDHMEVPLPSQEGNKSVVQYALCVDANLRSA